MSSLHMAWLALALAGAPQSSSSGAPPNALLGAPPSVSATSSLDSLEELKKDIAAKEGALDESAAVEFGSRALKLAKSAKDLEGRGEALKVCYTLKFRGKSAELDKLRGQLWDVLIEHDSGDAGLAALVSSYLTDAERAAALGKRTKLPEIKAACSFVPLNAEMKRTDRNEKDSKDLAVRLRAFEKEYGKLVDGRSKRPFSDVCDDLLFQLENLGIGCVAGEIEANDTSGVKFKLSDYRGKVVMLDFWGHW